MSQLTLIKTAVSEPGVGGIDFVGPYRSRGTLDLVGACDLLRWQWQRQPFQRLAGTPLDVDAGTVNPYWEIVRLMRREVRAWGDPWAVDMFGLDADQPSRRSLTKLYAWSIPSPADLLWMRDILGGRRVVEIGAGSGYWAWQLSQLGVDVAAFDSWEWRWRRHWHPVETGNTTAAQHFPDRALMLIWPPYGSPMAKTALDFYEGDLLFYAGEGDFGCTADDAFHEELERSWVEIGVAPHHPTFDGIHCRLTAYRRAVTA